MKIGEAIRTVQVSCRAQCLGEVRFLTVRVGQEELVAADLTGAAPGDEVLLATGTAAARSCMEAPVDAAVVAVVRKCEKIN